jgi:hypothetical protein
MGLLPLIVWGLRMGAGGMPGPRTPTAIFVSRANFQTAISQVNFAGPLVSAVDFQVLTSKVNFGSGANS